MPFKINVHSYEDGKSQEFLVDAHIVTNIAVGQNPLTGKPEVHYLPTERLELHLAGGKGAVTFGDASKLRWELGDDWAEMRKAQTEQFRAEAEKADIDAKVAQAQNNASKLVAVPAGAEK